MPNLSKKNRVLNYLSSGKSISAAQARSWFGVRNLRATMSDIRSLVEFYGNWHITNDEGRYQMIDTHPGRRTFKFNRDGSRSKITN